MLRKVYCHRVLFIWLWLWCAGVFPAYTQTPVREIAPPLTDDVQQWNEFEFLIKSRDNLDVVLGGDVRLGRNIARPVDERIGAGVRYRPTSWLTADATYRRIYTQPSRGRNGSENRYILGLTPSFRIGKFTIADRNRIEIRRRSTTNTVQYRNRLRVDRPFAIKNQKLAWFVFDEPFYDSRERAWIRNRAAVGISKQFNERIYGELFYLRQWDGFGRPGDIHAVGTLLRVRLR